MNKDVASEIPKENEQRVPSTIITVIDNPSIHDEHRMSASIHQTQQPISQSTTNTTIDEAKLLPVEEGIIVGDAVDEQVLDPKKKPILGAHINANASMQMDESKGSEKEEKSVKSDAKTSWHIEMLLSLFMRSEEKELRYLAEQSGINSFSLFSSSSNNEKNNPLNNNSSKSYPKTTTSSRRGLRLSKEPSELPILHHALQDIGENADCSQMSVKEFHTYFAKKYKRKDYASRTVSEMESAVMDKFNDVAPTSSEQDFKPFTLLYNECSISALSSWVYQSPESTKPQIKPKMNFYYQPTAAAAFRRCGICQTFGHYEVECEELAQRNISMDILSRGLKVEQRAAKEVGIQKPLKDFVLMNQKNKGYDAYTQQKEKQFISYPWTNFECDELLKKNISDRLARRNVTANVSDNDTFLNTVSLASETEFGSVNLSVGKDQKNLSKNDNPRSSTNISNENLYNEKVTKDENEIIATLSKRITTTNTMEGNSLDNERDSKNESGSIFIPRKTTETSNERSNSLLDRIEECEICGSSFGLYDSLMCDGCDKLFHLSCLDPPLVKVPKGDWFCDNCRSYDSDVSSVSVIEGLDNFVIEQRKIRAVEKEVCRREEELRVGFKHDQWNASITTASKLAKSSEIYDERIEDIAPDLSREWKATKNEKEDPVFETLSDFGGCSSNVSLGELCWAKRRGTHTSKKANAIDFFWPAVVIHVHNNSIAFDGTIQTPYIVKFFNLPAGGRIRASKILPFYPFYEELGVQRLKMKKMDWSNDFHAAIVDAINYSGFASVEDAFIYSQHDMDSVQESISSRVGSEGNAMTKSTTGKSRGLKENKQRSSLRPRHWQRAEKIEIDGIEIFSKRKDVENIAVESKDGDCDSASSSNNGNGTFEGKDITSEIWENYEDKCTLQELLCNETKPIEIDKLVGSIVVYHVGDGSDGRRASTNFGIVDSFDKTFGKVLIRNVRKMQDFFMTQHHTEAKEAENTVNESKSFSMGMGSSEWRKPEELIHLTAIPSTENSNFCKSTVNLTLEKTREQLLRYYTRYAKHREFGMVELTSESEEDEYLVVLESSDGDSKDRISTISDVKTISNNITCSAKQDEKAGTGNTSHEVTISVARQIMDGDDAINISSVNDPRADDQSDGHDQVHEQVTVSNTELNVVNSKRCTDITIETQETSSNGHDQVHEQVTVRKTAVNSERCAGITLETQETSHAIVPSPNAISAVQTPVEKDESTVMEPFESKTKEDLKIIGTEKTCVRDLSAAKETKKSEDIISSPKAFSGSESTAKFHQSIDTELSKGTAVAELTGEYTIKYPSTKQAHNFEFTENIVASKEKEKATDAGESANHECTGKQIYDSKNTERINAANTTEQATSITNETTDRKSSKTIVKKLVVESTNFESSAKQINETMSGINLDDIADTLTEKPAQDANTRLLATQMNTPKDTGSWFSIPTIPNSKKFVENELISKPKEGTSDSTSVTKELKETLMRKPTSKEPQKFSNISAMTPTKAFLSSNFTTETHQSIKPDLSKCRAIAEESKQSTIKDPSTKHAHNSESMQSIIATEAEKATDAELTEGSANHECTGKRMHGSKENRSSTSIVPEKSVNNGPVLEQAYEDTVDNPVVHTVEKKATERKKSWLTSRNLGRRNELTLAGIERYWWWVNEREDLALAGIKQFFVTVEKEEVLVKPISNQMKKFKDVENSNSLSMKDAKESSSNEPLTKQDGESSGSIPAKDTETRKTVSNERAELQIQKFINLESSSNKSTEEKDSATQQSNERLEKQDRESSGSIPAKDTETRKTVSDERTELQIQKSINLESSSTKSTKEKDSTTQQTTAKKKLKLINLKPRSILMKKRPNSKYIKSSTTTLAIETKKAAQFQPTTTQHCAAGLLTTKISKQVGNNNEFTAKQASSHSIDTEYTNRSANSESLVKHIPNSEGVESSKHASVIDSKIVKKSQMKDSMGNESKRFRQSKDDRATSSIIIGEESKNSTINEGKSTHSRDPKDINYSTSLLMVETKQQVLNKKNHKDNEASNRIFGKRAISTTTGTKAAPLMNTGTSFLNDSIGNISSSKDIRTNKGGNHKSKTHQTEESEIPTKMTSGSSTSSKSFDSVCEIISDAPKRMSSSKDFRATKDDNHKAGKDNSRRENTGIITKTKASILSRSSKAFDSSHNGSITKNADNGDNGDNADIDNKSSPYQDDKDRVAETIEVQATDIKEPWMHLKVKPLQDEKSTDSEISLTTGRYTSENLKVIITIPSDTKQESRKSEIFTKRNKRKRSSQISNSHEVTSTREKRKRSSQISNSHEAASTSEERKRSSQISNSHEAASTSEKRKRRSQISDSPEAASTSEKRKRRSQISDSHEAASTSESTTEAFEADESVDLTEVDGTASPPIKGIPDEDGEIFQMEKIIDDRMNGRKKEYCIKWKGFDDSHNTWENERNILDPFFLRKYQCRKHINILKKTTEAKNKKSTTRRAIKALRYGIENMGNNPDLLASRRRTCPFCLKVIKDMKKLGGHVKSHKDEPNYMLLKELSKVVVRDWYEE